MDTNICHLLEKHNFLIKHLYTILPIFTVTTHVIPSFYNSDIPPLQRCNAMFFEKDKSSIWRTNESKNVQSFVTEVKIALDN